MTMTIQGPGIKAVPKAAPKSVRSIMDTVLVTPGGLERWKLPPFQRPLKASTKVTALIEELKLNGGVIPGVLTLGKLNGETYLIDGQHRIHAFKQAELKEGYADVRICHFDTMAEMGEEFVQLNSALVRLQTDDILRGLEGVHEGLRKVRRKCPFIGYDRIRMGPKGPILSMSVAIRAWFGSQREVPQGSGSMPYLASLLTEDEAEDMAEAFSVLYEAWGAENEYRRLWGTLNVTLCLWLYRRMVSHHDKSSRVTKLTRDLFRKCLMSLSASAKYLEFLIGRNGNTERDRSPAMTRIRLAFQQRMQLESIKLTFPIGSWYSPSGKPSVVI